ncbi:MAG: hypothetical protein AB7G37_19760, partial [Solirubrobacteraceae bacterium]
RRSLPTGIVAAVALLLVAVAALQPVRPVGAAAVVVLLGTLGHGVLGAPTAGWPGPLRLGTALAVPYVGFGAVALAAADLGAFGPVVLAAVALLLVAVTVRTARGPAARIAPATLLTLALIGAGTATIPAYAFDLGGRDAGHYVLTGERLREEGRITVRLDPGVAEALARFGSQGHLGLDRNRPLPGLFVTRGGDLVPHGYHLAPAAMASGATVTGGGGQWVITLGGVIVVLLAAALAQLLVRPAQRRLAGGVALALMAANAALIYFSRYPMTEVVAATAVVGGGVLGAVAVRGGSARVALASGLLLGLAPLVRPDAWPLIVAAPLVALLLARRRSAATWWLAVGFVPAVAYATARAVFVTDGYTAENVGRVVDVVGGVQIVVAIAAVAVGAVIAAAWWAWRHPARTVRTAIEDGSAGIPVGLPVALRRLLALLVAVAGLVVALVPPTEGLEIFVTYATVPAVLLVTAGLVAVLLGVVTVPRTAVAAVPVLVLGAVALALVSGRPQVVVADQYWTARRYLPAALPVTVALASATLALLWGATRPAGAAAMPWIGRARPLVAVGLGVVVAGALGLSLWAAGPAITVTEYDGVPEQVDRIDALIDRAADPGSSPLILAGPDDTAWTALGPALAARGRAVMTTAPGALAATPPRLEIADPRLVRWLRAQADRRPVLVLASGASIRRLFDGTIDARATLVDRATLSVRHVDRRVGGPPRGESTDTTTVSVVRLWPHAER